MAGILIRTALRRSLTQIRHVAPVKPNKATGLVEQVYRQVERDFGMLAPPTALHSPAPQVLAAAWAMLRESLIATGNADRATKEAVAAGVSESNTCPYCVEVHDATLKSLSPQPDQAIVEWARNSGRRDADNPWPFPEDQAPELVGVAVTFHYLNRMVHIFLPDSPLPPTVPPNARVHARKFLGRVMRGSATRTIAPGTAVDLLPEAGAPEDLAWAQGNPTLATAFARAYAAIDAAPIPASVRDLLADELSNWDGQPPGLGRAWVTAATATLPESDRPAGQLALLAAKAAYQIDDDLIAAYQRDDASLVQLLAWASLSAARRVGAWSRQSLTR